MRTRIISVKIETDEYQKKKMSKIKKKKKN
jgi:hypothetical protein